jgi:hypothetical protein
MSYSVKAELSRHRSTYSFHCKSYKIPAGRAITLPLFVPHRNQAQRTGQAQRIGGFGSPPTTAIQLVGSGVSPGNDNPTRTHAKESQAGRSGQAKRSGKSEFGVSPGYYYSSRTYAEEGPADSGQAERSREGPRGLPRLRHHTAHPRAEGSQARRPGRSLRKRRVRRFLLATATHLARTSKKAKPTATRPSAAEKGSGVSPD